MVKKYRSIITSIINPLEGIYTIEFRSLNGIYKFLPGQFLHLAIDKDYDGTGQWPESKCFSMQSSPGENNIRITYAVKGRFTANMAKEMRAGNEVWLKLPYGDLFQQLHTKEKTVFIAGGTGITPFLSLFTDRTFAEYIAPKIYIGFRSKFFNIYEEELYRVCNSTSSINTFYEDVNGIIEIEKVFEENGAESNYFISGPPMMIKTFKTALIEKGLGAEQIKTDDWQ